MTWIVTTVTLSCVMGIAHPHNKQQSAFGLCGGHHWDKYTQEQGAIYFCHEGTAVDTSSRGAYAGWQLLMHCNAPL